MVSYWTVIWLVGGVLISGSQHHQPSGSKWSGVYRFVGSIQLIFPPGGIFISAKQFKDIVMHIPWEDQDTAPRLHYFVYVYGRGVILTVLPLSLYHLPSLISNCWTSLEFRVKGYWMKTISVTKKCCRKENTSEPTGWWLNGLMISNILFLLKWQVTLFSPHVWWPRPHRALLSH